LIAQSTINEGVGKAVYLAPDTYLAARVREESARLGLATAERHDDPRFLTERAILVTVSWKPRNAAYNDSDFRWVAELVGHLVFADPSHAQARELQAAAFEQLAFGAENGTWRNFFLTGALELRGGSSDPDGLGITGRACRALRAATLRQHGHTDGPRAWDLRLTIDWTFNDTGEQDRTSIVNGCSPTAPARAATQPTR
jgi:alkyl sulfatase BDS1-like metallo-beta-lactamase superfamily hydrolase